MIVGTLVKIKNDEDRLGIIKKICNDGWTIVQLLTGSMIEADISHFTPAQINFQIMTKELS